MRIALALPQKAAKGSIESHFPDPKPLKKYKPDLVVFPEQFLFSENETAKKTMKKWAHEVGAYCLVGVLICYEDMPDENSQFNVGFNPTSTGQKVYLEDYYIKHSAAGNSCTEWDNCSKEDYDFNETLGPYIWRSKKIAATICHDLYLGGLYTVQKRLGSQFFVNSTYFKVQDAKWGVLARMRALEHSVPMLVTMHAHEQETRHHPFAFDANGQALPGIRVSDGREMQPDEMYGAGEIFVFDLPGPKAKGRLQAIRDLPACRKNSGENCRRQDSVRLRMEAGQLESDSTRDDLAIVRLKKMDLLDFTKCFDPLLENHRQAKKSVLWNDWGNQDPPTAQWLHLMLARSLEFSIPVVLTAGDRILEITERASDHKQIRRCRIGADRAWVELKWADALERSFNITCSNYKYKEDRLQAFSHNLELYRMAIHDEMGPEAKAEDNAEA